MFEILLQLEYKGEYFCPMSSQPPKWQEVQSKYQEGDLNQTLALLKAEPRLDSAAYCYNLGTVYFRLGQAGESVAYLEKANHLLKDDPDIQTNLNLARTALMEKIGESQVDPASSWIEQKLEGVDSEAFLGILLPLGTVLVLVWMRKYLRTRDLKKTLLCSSSYFFFLPFLIFSSLYLTTVWVSVSPPAMVLSSQIIRSGPGDQYLELGRVHSGAKVRLVGKKNQEKFSGKTDVWRQIRYSKGGIGWISQAALLPL